MVKARRIPRPDAGKRDRPSPCQGHRADADAYRRQARRLRARYHGQPARLQQSLCALSHTCDATRGVRPADLAPPPLTAVLEVPPESLRKFSAIVRDQLEGQILRFEPR